MTQVFDAIVIGAGQAGPSLAGRLTAAGMKVALIERKLFGGTCVNTGCIPTKTLVASAYAAHLAGGVPSTGSRSSSIEIDMKRVRARADAVSTNARTNLETWLRGMDGLTIIEGHARFEGGYRPGGREPAEGAAHLHQCRRTRERARFAERRHGGLSHQYVDPQARYDPAAPGRGRRKLYRARFAHMYRRFGAEVKVIEMAPRLISREDGDVSAAVQEI